MENLSATSAHLDFTSHGYNSHLAAPPPSADQPRHIPDADDLESYVPSLPTGWATGSQGVPQASKKVASVKKEAVDKKKGTRHRLPKGAAADKAFTEDVSLLLQLRFALGKC